jgi:2-oxo-3-hexenedioate decarboxylase
MNARTLPDPETLLAAADAGRALSIDTPTDTPTDAPAAAPAAADPADIDAALRIQAAIGALRRARGERPVGWKIGFTNRTIWPLYGVRQPIWGPVWDTTLRLLDGTEASVDLDRLSEPRLEPEVVIGLKASPPVQADARDAAATAALVACIDWVAHGFEIVHSVWPGWKFGAAQGIAAQALHGSLLVGPRVPLAALGPDPAGALSALRIVLWRDGERIADGVGANVLDGPVQALGHLVAGLAARGERVAAGSVVTTGTLTDAQPLARGQAWRTEVAGVPLAGLALRVR